MGGRLVGCTLYTFINFIIIIISIIIIIIIIFNIIIIDIIINIIIITLITTIVIIVKRVKGFKGVSVTISAYYGGVCVRGGGGGVTVRNICCSLSCFATSLAEEPETSIQVLENRAHAPSMKAM
jgi:hypothetical protein